MVVVVQHDDQVAIGVAGVVESLVREPTPHGPVANDRHHAEVVPIQVACDRRAQGG